VEEVAARKKDREGARCGGGGGVAIEGTYLWTFTWLSLAARQEMPWGG